MQMKLPKILMFGIVLMVFGLVPPEKGPNGIAPPLDDTNTSDFSMAIYFIISILGISIVYAIFKNRIIPNKRMNTQVFDAYLPIISLCPAKKRVFFPTDLP